MNKKLSRGSANILGSLVLKVAQEASNFICYGIYHEVEMPEEVKSMSRFQAEKDS